MDLYRIYRASACPRSAVNRPSVWDLELGISGQGVGCGGWGLKLFKPERWNSNFKEEPEKFFAFLQAIQAIPSTQMHDGVNQQQSQSIRPTGGWFVCGRSIACLAPLAITLRAGRKIIGIKYGVYCSIVLIRSPIRKSFGKRLEASGFYSAL